MTILLKPLLRKKVLVSLFFLFLTALILGFLLRIEGFITGNILFLYDNARDLLYVQKIVIDHKPILIGPSSGGLQGYFHGVFWYYLLAIPFFIGNGNPIFMTGFMVVGSMISVLLAFYLLRKIQHMYAAIFIGIIFSLASFSVDTTRFIWNPYPIVWLMPIYFFALYSFSQKKRYAFPLLAFLTSLIIHFEAIYGVCLLPVLCLTGFIEAKRVFQKKDFLPFVVAFLLFFIPIAPTLLFDFRHDFLITKSLSNAFLSGGDALTRGENEAPTSLLTRVVQRGTDLYSFTIQSVTPNVFMNLFLMILLFYGIRIFLKDKKNSRLFLLLCILVLITPFFFFLFLKYSVWSYYWIGNPSFYACFLAFMGGIVIQRHQKKAGWIFVILACSLLVAYQPVQSIQKNFFVYVAPGYNNLQTQMDIVGIIHNDAKENPYSVYVLTPPVYDYVYRYLFLWKQHTTGKSAPDDTKQKIIYLILEPSPSDPTGNFFRKNVIRTKNQPIQVLHFPGGIRVEKIIPSSDEKEMDSSYIPQI